MVNSGPVLQAEEIGGGDTVHGGRTLAWVSASVEMGSAGHMFI